MRKNGLVTMSLGLHGNEVLEVPYNGKMLYFDPIHHVYTLDDQDLMSVTRYLLEAGYQHAWRGDGTRATFGRFVHEATVLHDVNDLDWENLDDSIAKRVKAWIKFREENKFIPDMALRELPCYHPELLYGMTPDAPGTLDGEPCVVEIKTGKKEKWHRLQVAGAYTPALAIHHPRYKDARSLVVYLNADETYDIVEAENPNECRMLFAYIVSVVNGREHYGYRKRIFTTAKDNY